MNHSRQHVIGKHGNAHFTHGREILLNGCNLRMNTFVNKYHFKITFRQIIVNHFTFLSSILFGLFNLQASSLYALFYSRSFSHSLTSWSFYSFIRLDVKGANGLHLFQQFFFTNFKIEVQRDYMETSMLCLAGCSGGKGQRVRVLLLFTSDKRSTPHFYKWIVLSLCMERKRVLPLYTVTLITSFWETILTLILNVCVQLSL